MPMSALLMSVERTPTSVADTVTLTAARLRWLVRRIAGDDRDAFGELFDRVSGPVSWALSRQVSDPVRVAGVVASTFVEVWWLAGGHVDPDTDVVEWIADIVGRRAADGRPPAADSAAATAANLSRLRTESAEAELAKLLARRRTP